MLRFGKDYISDLKREFHEYNGKKLRKDILAGITVAAVALPLALAFGVSSGADGASGLIAAIVAALVIGALSGASFQISGPTGAMAAILIPLAVKNGMESLLAASLLSGVLLLLACILRLGKLVSYLPESVVVGFTSGIALIIALGQIGNLLGGTLEGEHTLFRVISFFRHGFSPNWYALGIGCLVVLLMLLWPQKWTSKAPASLVGVILATALQTIFTFPVAVVGEIPRALVHSTRLTPASFMQIPFSQIALPAISIAALGIIESLLCGVAAGRMKGETMNADRELFAQGIGNLILPFLGGVPATAAIARTSVAIKSGSVTRLTGIFHGIVLLLSMFLFSPLMSQIPLSALAGVLMVTAWRMNDWNSIRNMFSRKRIGSILPFAVTIVSTVLFDLTLALLAGILSAALVFIAQSAILQAKNGAFPAKNLTISISDSSPAQVISLSGVLFFGSLPRLKAALDTVQSAKQILSLEHVPFIDDSAALFLIEYAQSCQNRQTALRICGLQSDVQKTLGQVGCDHVSEYLSPNNITS